MILLKQSTNLSLLEILPLLSFCGGRAGSTDPGIVARNSDADVYGD